MQFDGEFVVDGTPAEVWPYFTDPEILEDCAPGCKELELVSLSELRATLEVGVGSVKPTFDVEAIVVECDEPNRLELEASGEASRNSFEVSAWQELVDNGDGTTTVTWGAETEISGVIASLGQRAIGSVTHKLVTEFFEAIEAHVDAGTPAESRLSAAAEPREPTVEPAPGGTVVGDVGGSDRAALYLAVAVGAIGGLLWIRNRGSDDGTGSESDEESGTDEEESEADEEASEAVEERSDTIEETQDTDGDSRGALRYLVLGAVLGVAGKLLWDLYASEDAEAATGVDRDRVDRSGPTEADETGERTAPGRSDGDVGGTLDDEDADGTDLDDEDADRTDLDGEDTDEGETEGDGTSEEGMVDDPLDRLN